MTRPHIDLKVVDNEPLFALEKRVEELEEALLMVIQCLEGTSIATDLHIAGPPYKGLPPGFNNPREVLHGIMHVFSSYVTERGLSGKARDQAIAFMDSMRNG